MTATQSSDADNLFASTPQLRAQLVQLQTTLSRQMNALAFLEPLGAAIRTKSNPFNYHNTQLVDSHAPLPSANPYSSLNPYSNPPSPNR